MSVSVDWAPDKRVVRAFALGWHVGELWYLPTDVPPPQELPEVKPPQSPAWLGELSFVTRLELLIAQIRADLKSLALEVGPEKTDGRPARQDDSLAELPTIDLGAIGSSQGQDFAAQVLPQVQGLHVAILTRLTVTDFQLGKAYGLGTGLAQTVLQSRGLMLKIKSKECDPDSARGELKELFRSERIARLYAQVKDLKSSFPHYGADPVAATLMDWGVWIRSRIERIENGIENGVISVDDPLLGFDPDSGRFAAAWAELLRRQGQVWRALLSAERKPTDVLLVADYVEAVGHLVGQYSKLVRRFLGRFWLTVMGVFLVGALVLIVLFLFQRYLDRVVAVMGAAVAALGVSGASVIAALRRGLDQARTALWETEMTASIGVAIDYVPETILDPQVERLRWSQPGPLARKRTEVTIPILPALKRSNKRPVR